MMKIPKVLGVCGPSGSGKTTLVNSLSKLSPLNIVVIPQDNFYYDLSSLGSELLRQYNFDSTEAVDFDRIAKLVSQLLDGEKVYLPEYDFISKRSRVTERPLSEADLIVVEGTMIFQDETLSNFFDIKVFLDVEEDVCFIRRLLRDTRDRGYSVQQVCDYYMKFVKPQNMAYSTIKKDVDLCIRETDKRDQTEVLLTLVKKLFL